MRYIPALPLLFTPFSTFSVSGRKKTADEDVHARELQTGSRQVYVPTLFFDQVTDLNAPVFKADDWGKARSLLVKLASSMKTYDQRLDPDALSRKLNRVKKTLVS